MQAAENIYFYAGEHGIKATVEQMIKKNRLPIQAHNTNFFKSPHEDLED